MDHRKQSTTLIDTRWCQQPTRFRTCSAKN